MTRLTCKCLMLLSVTLSAALAHATHLRAGEITYKHIAGYTWEITAITYSDPTNTATDRSVIEITFGDGKSQLVTRSNGDGEILNTDPQMSVKKNIYVATHTFPGASSYIVSITDPNRVSGIRNINNGESVNLPFYTESMVVISTSASDVNHSPVITLPPIGNACVNKPFFYKGLATDEDGDSLTFHVVAPKIASGTAAPGFLLPAASNAFSISNTNGDINWNTPLVPGYYAIAMQVKEYRMGQLIGFIMRDMQIYVQQNCLNGIAVTSQDVQLTTWPNPVTDKLNVSFVLNQSGNVAFEIYNIAGERVQVTSMVKPGAGRQDSEIDTRGLNNGVYFLKLSSEVSTRAVRFIVNH